MTQSQNLSPLLTSLISPGLSASASFTPAASSHTANDVVGGAQTFAFGAVSGSEISIDYFTIEVDGGTAEASAFRLYLYNVTPPSATADDGAWDYASGDRASYLGHVDLGTPIDLGSTLWNEGGPTLGKRVRLTGTSVFGYLINLTTVTTAAVARVVTLHATQL